jgi:hypothetical protein
VILDDDRKVTRINIRQLGTITVTTTDDPLLRVIIIGTGEKVTEYKFGIPETFLFVHFYRNPTERTVVLDGH